MKIKTRLLLAALLCLLGVGKASAQVFTPHFSIYVSEAASFPLPADGSDLSSTAPITITQTVTLSGYTSLGGGVQMPYPTVQHWATITNSPKKGTTTYSAPGTSARVCATCQIHVSTSVSIPTFLGDNDDVDNNGPVFDLNCSLLQGHFGQGSFMRQFIRVLEGAVSPNSPPIQTNCVTGGTTNIKVCDISTHNICVGTVNGPAVNATEVRAVVSINNINKEATWWRLLDLCARATPGPSTAWLCPTFTYTVPYGNIGIPVGVPEAIDHYTAPIPPPYCDDLFKP